MKHLFLISLAFLFWCISAHSQKTPTPLEELPPCDCQALDWVRKVKKGYIPSGEAAEKKIREYLQHIVQHSSLRLPESPIYVREAVCSSPMAVLCEGDIRLILFKDSFMSIINQDDKQPMTLVDKHVLAHELGHHVLGHFKTVGPLSKIEQFYEKEQEYIRRHFNLSNDNPMAQEIEADLFALWLLGKTEKNFTAEKLIVQMDTLRLWQEDNKKKEATTAKPKETPKPTKVIGKSYGTHPFFKDRIDLMRKYQNLVRRLPATVARRGFAEVSNNAYFDLWPGRHYWDLSLSAGVILAGLPQFSVQGQQAPAFLYHLQEQPSFQAGISITRFRWDKPRYLSLDIHWSQQQYGTILQTAQGNKLAEKLQFDYLNFCPQVGWNSALNKKERLRSLKIGFIGSIGLNVCVPFREITYTNHLTPVAAPTLKPSVVPKFSLGIARLRKSISPRHLKWLVNYEPHWIRLDTTPTPVAFSHNISTTLQYAIFRR